MSFLGFPFLMSPWFSCNDLPLSACTRIVEFIFTVQESHLLNKFIIKKKLI
jgi:hypothetical protein